MVTAQTGSLSRVQLHDASSDWCSHPPAARDFRNSPRRRSSISSRAWPHPSFVFHILGQGSPRETAAVASASLNKRSTPIEQVASKASMSRSKGPPLRSRRSAESKTRRAEVTSGSRPSSDGVLGSFEHVLL